MLAGTCAYTAQGVSYAISNYLYSYVWQFKGYAFLYMSLALFTGVGVAFVLAQFIGRRASKPIAATVAIFAAGLVSTSPYILRLLGLFPSPESGWMLPAVYLFATLSTTCSVTSYILGSSMMADVAEDSQSRTGRRSEGTFYAGGFFVQKCTSGLGIFVTGIILDVAGFPEKATPGQVPVATIDRLTLIYICVYIAFTAAAAFCYTRFPFGRREHEARLAHLAGVQPIADPQL
jgi:glycoside/pentoside/hexuronide:cation symporter, GPH family